MTGEWAFALVLFALATSLTPGPNNVMLMTSGVNFGFRRTMPHMVGVSLGFALMVLLVGLGLGAVMAAFPLFQIALKYVGAAYLLYLAWHIASAEPSLAGGRSSRPMSFVEAALFQWVNPKAWAMAVGAIVAYVPSNGVLWNVVLVALIFALVNLPSVGVWALFGTALRPLLTRPAAMRAFNVAMALLLVLSLYPILA